MSRIASFVCGVGFGIFTAQNYEIPDIKKLGDKLIDYVKSMEKNDK